MTAYGPSTRMTGGARRLLRYLGMPILLLFLCLAMYLYIGSKDLDSIERRQINAQVITELLIEHIQLALVSTVIVVVLAVGAGILRNTMVGLQQVDRSTIEAARGMGMTKTAVLYRIELPLAVPIILAGIRTALIINVGTATLGTFIGAGGLGESIKNAIRLDRTVVLVTASGVTAIVALFVDWLAGVAEDVLRPRGL